MMAEPGEIALVTQSGAMATTMIDWARRNRVGLSSVVSLGDMSDVDFGDVLDYLAAAPETRAVLLYIEAVTHARKFISASRAASRTKPIIAIKAGRSAEGARAAASHTGAMASVDAVYDAAFERAGILRVGDIDELFAAAETIARVPRLSGDRLAIVTNGGGLGVLATDALIGAGGRLAALSPATIVAQLNELLPSTWSRGNPVDLIGDADADRYAAALRIVAADPEVDATLVLNCPVAVTSGLAVAEALATVARSAGHTFLACWMGGVDLEKVRQLFAGERIAKLRHPARRDHRVSSPRPAQADAQETILEVPPATARPVQTDGASIRITIAAAIAAGRAWLDEREAKDLLRAYGIPANPTVMARSPAEAADAASSMGGDGFVVKILSPDITHKSDVGGVVLNLKGPAEVGKGQQGDVGASVAAARPDARILGITVQPMVHLPRAWELIVGLSVDLLFGPVIMFGHGGTAVEVIGDRALALPPLNSPLARGLIDRTRISRLLRGFRDRPPAKIDAIADVLVRVSEIARRFSRDCRTRYQPAVG